MAAASKHGVRNAIVLTTLLVCAFFTAQGATALLSAKVLEADPGLAKPALATRIVPAPAQRKHDPGVILRRNIFDSTTGDLSAAPVEDRALPDAEMPMEEVELPCKNSMRLIGTVVLPGELEQSLAAIVGSDDKAGLHRGGAEVEGSRIRSIQSDNVILQTETGFCRLTMFEVDGAAPKPARAIATPEKRTRTPRRGPDADRNAGLSPDELEQGIEKINDTNYNISRTMLNKVLDNAGRLIGIAAVSPKVEGGQSVGMEIRGIRANTLLTKLGIQNGDVLESVNGQSLTSTDAALGAYTTLRTADKFNLSIRRGGQSMIINYNTQ
ncbi:MAG: type II secretion system protein GspC [Polyangiales bacterium]